MTKSVAGVWTAMFVARCRTSSYGLCHGAGFAVLDSFERVELQLKKILYSVGVGGGIWNQGGQLSYLLGRRFWE